MKFCYLDESGMGNEPILVMAGIIVDAQRMHQTKGAWGGFLESLSKATGRKINEFHTRNFYSGNGVWRTIDGPSRAMIITTILDWIAERKHYITFNAIDKQCFEAQKGNGGFDGISSPWCAAALHCILGLQKHHQRERNNKGHTVIIFDREVKEEKLLADLVSNPPDWTNLYYGKGLKQIKLDQIVDIPFFVDSEHALLIQVADIVSYVLRVYAELEAGITKERYSGEHKRMASWVNQIYKRTIPASMRYPTKARDAAAEQFWEVAPKCLRR